MQLAHQKAIFMNGSGAESASGVIGGKPQLQGRCPGARQGRSPVGFGWSPLFRRYAPPSPPKKRKRFSNPCTCRPSLASDASWVLANANTEIHFRYGKEPDMNVENRTSQLAANALATLTKALESGDSQVLSTYLSVMARFHTYSWNNSLLIAVQRPSATRVAGFRAWLGLGRHVRKGEKGIAILAPVLCKVKDVDEPVADERFGAHAFRRLVGFRTAYVFDIAQTEGQEMPEFSSVKGDPEGNTAALKSFACSRGIGLEYDQNIAPAYGASHGGNISLLPGLSAAVEFSTLAHEVAHELLHRGDRRSRTTRTIRETEAEAVAFVVCQAIGLDTNTAAVDYIKLYNGDAATLSASFHLIQSTAEEILAALEMGNSKEPDREEA